MNKEQSYGWKSDYSWQLSAITVKVLNPSQEELVRGMGCASGDWSSPICRDARDGDRFNAHARPDRQADWRYSGWKCQQVRLGVPIKHTPQSLFERCSLKTVSTSRQMAVMVGIINLSYPSYSVKIYVTITIQNIDKFKVLCYYFL